MYRSCQSKEVERDEKPAVVEERDLQPQILATEHDQVHRHVDRIPHCSAKADMNNLHILVKYLCIT
jgi:hypothetical protein